MSLCPLKQPMDAANLEFHLVSVLFGFLIFDASFFYLIGQLRYGKARINPSRVLQ